ncbi:MAG: homoserine O-succinyltransferase [SAR324 cluster bacterium]|nr:homoserine O-succinyltransferase [SAR324 cluster bacterium]
MTVILPENYHIHSILEANRVTCIRREDAVRQDIRPMRIGVMHALPVDENFEANILHPFGLSIIQVEPVWIKLRSYPDKLEGDHLQELYVSYEEAIKDEPLDGLIVNGASIEQIPFESVNDWDEICEILLDSKMKCPSTLGIGWGALALAYLEGIEKSEYSQRHFGVYPVENIYPFHEITGELDNSFWCPQNRLAGIEDQILERAAEEKRINLLAHGQESGYVIFETQDHRFVMHTGHPEYNVLKLIEEAKRSQTSEKIHSRSNFDPEKPVNRWQGHRNSFFTQWLKYCYTNVSLSP